MAAGKTQAERLGDITPAPRMCEAIQDILGWLEFGGCPNVETLDVSGRISATPAT